MKREGIFIMRDLAEGTHSNFLKKNRYYYKENLRSKTEPNDYIYFVKNYITNENFPVVFKDPWTYLGISNTNRMANGWKIHISATFKNHIEILNIVAKYVIEKQMNFKFSTNLEQFIYINGKNVARVSSGKFIVIYPSEQAFLTTLEDLYNLLKGFDGPYILSDRPYKDSKIIYYRYGEINPIRVLDGYGTLSTKMIDNKNELISDSRVPYFNIPEFVEDNIYKPVDEGKSKMLAKYKIKESLYFSAQGGAYLGTYNNQDYVIKEARKYTGLDGEHNYATERLKKEYTTMKYLEDLDCVPMTIELIEEYGNVYLVEEYITGKNLGHFAIDRSPLVNRDRKENRIKPDYTRDLIAIVNSTLQAVSKIHSKGIILNDISPNNLIFNSESGSITFIDYEAAFHITDECNKINLYTPGFASEEDQSAYKKDLHKFGLVFIACIMPINNIFSLSIKKKAEIIKFFEKLNVIPQNIINTINGLVNYEFNDAEEALEYLNANHLDMIQDEELKEIKNDIENIKLIKESIISNIDCFSSESMFASDPMAFLTSQYSFAFGIFGVLYSLKKINIGENISSDKTQEIVNRFMTHFYRFSNSISAGLFVGLSGIAASLMELGYKNEAIIVMEKLIQKEMGMADLAYGLSGRIVALLKLYKTTNDIKYLDLAKKDADEIKRTAIVRDDLYYWKDEIGDIYTGLTRGSSGVALALLYLYLETEDKQYIDMGVKALEGDLDKLIKDDLENIGFNSIPEGKETQIYSPYIHNGIAGLGCVLLRYFLITRKEEYRSILDEIIEVCESDLTLYPGYLRGMSGIITFLQDCVVYLNSDYANELLMRLSENISFFQVSFDDIHGYAGDGLYRMSNDLFTGSSGVILALNRNICLSDKQGNPFFIIDEYYDFNNSKIYI